MPAANAAMADGDADDAIAWPKTIPKRFLPRDLVTDPAFAPIRERADLKALFE